MHCPQGYAAVPLMKGARHNITSGTLHASDEKCADRDAESCEKRDAYRASDDLGRTVHDETYA